MDYIYLRAGRVRPGGGVRVKTNLIFLSWGALGGSKQIITKKWGGRQIIIIFFYNLRRDDFFFKCESKTGRGDDPGQLKKSGRVG